MPRIATSRNLIVGASAAPVFNIDASPEGVAIVIEADGVRHVAGFTVDEAVACAVAMIRLAERATIFAEQKKMQGATGAAGFVT